MKSESGNHESMNCLSWVSWLPDENTTNYGLRDCESRKVGHQGITFRSLHPPPPSSSAELRRDKGYGVAGNFPVIRPGKITRGFLFDL